MEDQQNYENTNPNGRPVRASLTAPAMLLTIVLLIAVAQGTARYTDHQIANIATAVLMFAFVATLLFWSMRRLQGTIWFWGLPFGLVLAIGCAATLFEFTSFSGELVPQFRYRFAPKEVPMSLAESAEQLTSADSQLVITNDCFPGFLGPQRNGYIDKRTFSNNWESNPLQLIWKHAIGAGLAGFATAEIHSTSGDVTPIGITLEQRGESEAVTCYDLVTGNLLWINEHKAFHTHPLGDTGPRSTPTIASSGLVYALGATGHAWCIKGTSGEIVWEQDLLTLSGIDQANSEANVTWGRSASPLLVDDMVIIPLGGAEKSPLGIRTLVALDASTGEPIWYGGDHQISYASPVLVKLSGKRQIVSVNQNFVSGHDVNTGEMLWSSDWPGVSNGGANCSNPTLVDNDKILLSKGYGGGAKLLQITSSNDSLEAEELWSSSRVLKTKFTNPVIHDGFAYGISDGTLECISLEDGISAWKQSRSSRFGHGHILIVEDVILASTEDGELVLVDLNPNQYVELGRFQAIEGKTWNPIALWGTKVLVRNGFEMALWELGSR